MSGVDMAAPVSSEDFINFQLLLKAPSKDAVRDVCVQSHRAPSRHLAETTAATLGVPAVQAAQLVRSLHVLSRHVLFDNLNSPEQILALFPESFHPSLKNLITKILLENSLSASVEGAGLESRHGDCFRLSQSYVCPNLPSPTQGRSNPEPRPSPCTDESEVVPVSSVGQVMLNQ